MLNVIAVLVSIVAVVGVGSYLVLEQTTEEPQQVSDQFVAAVQQGDADAAYALTGPALRSMTTKRQLTRLVRRLSAVVTTERSLEGKSIQASTGDGTIAAFVYKIGTDRGRSLYFKTQLDKENGQWRVLSFTSSLAKPSADVE